MGEGPDPYKKMGVNPRAPALGLKKIKHSTNPEASIDTCAIKTKRCKVCNKEFVSDTFSVCIHCRKSEKSDGNNLSISKKSNSHTPLYYNVTFGSEIDKISDMPNEDKPIHNNEKLRKSSSFSLLNADLNGNDPAKRIFAVESLCEIKDKEALSILIEGLKHNDSNIRWKIARQLGHLKDKNAVLALIEALKDTDSIVRNNAAWSLGEIGDKRAIDPLNHTLKDKNKIVAYNAKEALDKIKAFKKRF